MNNEPTLAVIMPNYNDEKMIPQAVQGVLNQTRQPDELMIIDDGSTDNSVEVIQSIVARHSHIRLLTSERNLGVVHAFNRALREIQSEYVAFVSMDDFNHPTWLEKSMAMLKEYPEAGICCSDLYFLHEDGNKTECRSHWSQKPQFFCGRDFAHVVNGHWIAGTTVVVKKQPFMEQGGYRPELLWHSDWFGWLVVAMRYGVCFIPECLVTLKVRKTSHSEVGRKNWEKQSVVLKNIFHLLNSAEFQDIVPHFLWGNIMNHFQHEAVLVILQNPDLWNPRNFMLVQQVIPKFNVSGSYHLANT